MEGDISRLVGQAQGGDKEAFGQIYKVFLPRIYRFIFLKVGDKFLAEDLCQTTFLKAWSALSSFSEKKGTLQAYLFRIAHNLVIDEFRKKKEISLEVLAEPAAADDPEGTAVKNDDRQYVRQLIKSLEPEEAELIQLYFFEELKVAEVAAVVGKNEGAVRVKIHRLLKKLREPRE